MQAQPDIMVKFNHTFVARLNAGSAKMNQIYKTYLLYAQFEINLKGTFTVFISG